ncbi:MBL fold metallo-hydrolase [Paenibacillus sp. HB172176]|uniref:MBL fold metallo-hydrolase n=1 Tax=Paenibacillus sp. HB172176 TaxID=2493690 RepID=UPI001F0FB360|nr:MBL fold metallo-hydrolase [Paenibacillus sp. HB172176]
MIRRFANQDSVEQHNSFKQFKRWRQERIRKLKLKDYSYQVPCAEPDVHFLHSNREQPSLTWVGHSTFLIQLAGLNIVTDPVWSEQMAFQKRLAPPGIPIDDVPPVDIVLISHSHYDHLNMNSLRRLAGKKQLLVPAGLSAKLKLRGFTRVQELHWWESTVIGGVKFTFVPSQHWTRRNPWDTNSSHWGGWVMEAPFASKKREHGDSIINRQRREDAERQSEAKRRSWEEGPSEFDRQSDTEQQSQIEQQCQVESLGGDEQRFEATAPLQNYNNSEAASHQERPRISHSPTIYFAGDSGYFQGFKDIGRRFQIDVALMPIGAYEPEWFMGPQHVTPEEAIQAYEDCGARLFVPMHYGAFKLADDTPREALDRLEAERCRRELDASRFILLPHGETWRIAAREVQAGSGNE